MQRTETQRITTQEVRAIVLGDEPKKGDSSLGLWEDDERYGAEGLMRRLFLSSTDLKIEPLTAPTGKVEPRVATSTIRSQLHSAKQNAAPEAPISLVKALDLDDTGPVDIIAELDAASPLNFTDSAKPVLKGKNTTPTAERTYINPRIDNAFPKPRIEEFEDFLFGLPELADPERAEKDITDEDTQEIPIIKIASGPEDPENQDFLIGLMPSWNDANASENVSENSRVSLKEKLATAIKGTRTMILENITTIMADIDSGRFIFEEIALQALTDIATGASISYTTVKEKIIAAKEYVQENSKPELADGANTDELVEPTPMTEDQLRLARLWKARQAAAIVLGVSLIAPGFSGIKLKKVKEKSLHDAKTTQESQGSHESDAKDFLARLAELGVVPSINLPGARPEAGNAKIEKPFVQEVGKLVYPPNLGAPRKVEGSDVLYYQMPENPHLYSFLSKEHASEFGVGKDDTCEAQRWGTKELIGFNYTIASAWHELHPESPLILADFNASIRHASHHVGEDSDLEDKLGLATNMDSPHYKLEYAKQLSEIILKTGVSKITFFNDLDLIEYHNAYAEQHGFSGWMEEAEDHRRHRHERVVAKVGAFEAPECGVETKAEPKITIPWMSEKVKRWEPFIIEASKEFGVDPNLIAIIAYIENKGEVGRDSPVGAQGPMQVMPDTGKGIAKELGVKDYDLRDPKTSFRFGTYYIGQLLKEYGKPGHGPSWDMSTLLAAIGYNGGPGAANGYLKGRVVEGEGPFCESRRYGDFAVKMWQERDDATSKAYEAYNEAINHCKIDPNSFPISELRELVNN